MFSEEIEDYYYAKKIEIEISNGLRVEVSKYFSTKKNLLTLQECVVENLEKMINRLKNGKENQ